MSAIAPKRYQIDAVNNALDIFRCAENQIQQAPDENSRRTASAFNGCVLLEAPTGAGKTLMAGLIAEQFARPDHRHNAKIVWFWFTPFAGLVEQAKSALKKDFTGLRVRDLTGERVAYSAAKWRCIRHHLGVGGGAQCRLAETAHQRRYGLIAG